MGLLSSVLGGLFGKKKKGGAIMPQVFPEPPQYANLRSQVASYLSSKIGQPEKYTGEFVAPLTDIEKTGLEQVREIGETPTHPVLEEGAEEVRKTLANNYDPETSVFYQAYRNRLMQELADAQRRLREEAAGAGRFFHGGRLEVTRRLQEDALRDLALQNAQLAERERERRLQVLPYALQFAESAQELPLQRAAALLQYGAIPRSLEQARLDALYREFLRQVAQEREDVARASQFIGGLPIYYPAYQPSQLPGLFSGIGSILGSIPWELVLGRGGGSPSIRVGTPPIIMR